MELAARIDELWESGTVEAGPIEAAIALLDRGEVRVAEKVGTAWVVHQWLKKAVLLSFRLNDNSVVEAGHTRFYDKVALKYAGYDAERFRAEGVRVVPPAVVRRGAFVAKNAVLMPSYVNIGANVGEGTMGLRTTVLIGGASMYMQMQAIKRKPHVFVATPGRLIDHLDQKTMKLDQVCVLVMDEADRMLDMGFAPQINQILDALPEERQTLLFSATLPADLARLVQASVNNPVRVMVAPSATTADGVTQAVHHTSHADKSDLLLSLLGADKDTALVFTRTKHRADRVGRMLDRAGHRVAVLHGDRSLSQRRAALEGFRRGAFRVLVATDIAAFSSLLI